MTKNEFAMFTQNAEWARRIGEKFASLHPEFEEEDVIQESYAALTEALKKYEPYGSFQAYAYRKIWRSLEKAFLESSVNTTSIDFVDGRIVMTIDTGIDIQAFVTAALECLSERERFVIQKMFFDSKTMDVIAHELWPDGRYRKERVRQIMVKAFHKMRRYAVVKGYHYDDFE